jgi:signal transduction histidine kinase
MIRKVNLIAALALSALTFIPSLSMAAGERATKAEAEAMVAKGVASVKAKADGAYVDITAPSKTYVDRDLYLVVYDITGKCLAHGQNPKPDGKEFVKERVELANSKGKFWHDYKFTDPLTKTVQAKQAYCEKVGNVIVCGGIYKL